MHQPQDHRISVVRGYDSHLPLQTFSEMNMAVKVIPKHSERYLSFKLGGLRFIDSAQCLASSPDKLVESAGFDALTITQENTPDNAHLLARKGVYPYEYMNGWARFEEASIPA